VISVPKFSPIIVKIVPPLIEPDIGEMEKTWALAENSRSEVLISPRLLCLIEK
jgi:hypothetical protein